MTIKSLNEVYEISEEISILIIVRHPYPIHVPNVFERSTIIPRTEAWHISEHGECCLDIPHNLKLAFKRCMRLAGFNVRANGFHH